MTRSERLLLLIFFLLIIAAMVQVAPLYGAAGAVTGLAAGLAVTGRLGRLRNRMDAKLGAELGADAVRTGFRLRPVLLRTVAQLLVIGSLVVPTLFVPFIGDELFAGAAAFLTAVPLVLTAARLRR